MEYNDGEMASVVREIARLTHEKKEANKDWNERIKELKKVLNELANVKGG